MLQYLHSLILLKNARKTAESDLSLATPPKVVRCIGPLPPCRSKGRERATDPPSLIADAYCAAFQRSGSPNDRRPLRNEGLEALVIFFRPSRISRTHFSFRCF